MLTNLFDLALDLQKGRYQPSRSVCFVTRSPKLREVFAADFRDRIVHHLVVRELEKIWEPRFIYDSYASRKGKGIHSAVDRLQGFMRKVTRNGKRAGFFLQLDIRSFFMSIDKRILFSLFDRDRKTSDVLRWVLSVLIFHDPTTNYCFKGNGRLLDAIPPHKTLFKTGLYKGLPIGNLTSQFFANVYLNELDQFVKHELKCRFYLRYVDDFILLAESEDQLLKWRQALSGFLEDHLALRLRGGDRVRRVSDGADFLGYVTRPGYRLVRKRVVNNFKYVLARTRDKMVVEMAGDAAAVGAAGRAVAGATVGATSVAQPEKKITRVTGAPAGANSFAQPTRVAVPGIRTLTIRPRMVLHLRQVLASYLGHFQHADSRYLVESIFTKHTWLRQLFVFDRGKLKMKALPVQTFPCMREQVWFFRRHYPGFILLFRVGRYVELYGKDARILREYAHLKLVKQHRGLRDSVGFPVSMTRGIRRKLLMRGHRTALVAQGVTGGRVRRRYVAELAFAT